MLFLKWLIYSVAIIITAYLLSGVSVDGVFTAVVTALVLGLINTIIKPVLIILTLPLNILTLGLFTFVINALLILLVGSIVPGFQVDGFLWALLFGLVLSLINTVLNLIISESTADSHHN